MRIKLNVTFGIVAMLFANLGFCQTAQQVLLNSYRYHDPQERWQQALFKSQISTELSPIMEQQIGQKEITTEIEINNAKGKFSIGTTIKNDDIKVSYLENDCEIMVNNKSDVDPDMIKKHIAMVNLSDCQTARPAVNYHIYLMGLPMKLVLDSAEVIGLDTAKIFFGTDHFAISVDYPENTWTFYFDKSTYALKGCEFKFKSNDFGEKILFDNEIEVDGMRMFGKRTWYALDGETWLATDDININ